MQCSQSASGIIPIYAALITLSGVFLTMLWNAYLQRAGEERRFQYTLKTDALKEAHSTEVLRAALRAELNQLRTILYMGIEVATRRRGQKPTGPFDVSQANWLKEIKARAKVYAETGEEAKEGWEILKWRIPFPRYFSVYEANIDKLGFLSEEEVAALTFAYYRYQERIGVVIYHSELKTPESSALKEPLDAKVGSYLPYDFKGPNRRSLVIDFRDIAYWADEAEKAITRRLFPPARM
jgi:hypothetical protein